MAASDAHGSRGRARSSCRRRARSRRARAADSFAVSSRAGPRASRRRSAKPIIAVDALLRERLLIDPRRRLAVGGNRGRSGAAAAQRDVWVVDPIDGTRAYLPACPTGRFRWRWSMRGRPVVAALYAPVTDELFLSIAGSGVTAQRRRRSRRARATRLRMAKLSGPKRRAREPGRDRARHLARCREFHRWHCGSPASPPARSMALSPGRDSHDWDLAAADLLVHEAGGLMSTVTGQSLIYNRPNPVHERAAGRRARASCGVAQPHPRSACRIRVTERSGSRDGVMVGPGSRRTVAASRVRRRTHRLDHVQFRDLDKLDIVGVYPNYATAYAAWKSKAQQTVDNAHMRYFIVHLHRLLDPETDQRAKR